MQEWQLDALMQQYQKPKVLALFAMMYDDVTYVYDDVTYVYDDVTFVREAKVLALFAMMYDDVIYVYDDVTFVRERGLLKQYQ